jgi:Bacterial regulatory proteins, luxR family
MAIVLSDTTDQSENTQHDHAALQQQVKSNLSRAMASTIEAMARLDRQMGILGQHARLQQGFQPFDPLARMLETERQIRQLMTPVQSQVIQTIDVFGREQDRLRQLTPIDLDWEYTTRRQLLERELLYSPFQSLIDYASQWDAIPRQLIGPWPLMGPWRDARTLHWLLWALQEGDSDDHEAALAELATMIRRPRLSREARLQLHYRARLMRMSPDEYCRRIVLPQAFLLVWGASNIPRRIQLGGNGQGRVLDAQGRWTPQVPADRLSTDLLANYLFDEIPKAVVCILTDQGYPTPSNDLWHARPIEKKDDQGTIERIPRVVRLQPGQRDVTLGPDHICGPSPEVMAILKLDLQKLATIASPQQRQILQLLLKGYSVPEIASELHIKSQAVHGQINRLQQKYRAG